MSKITFQQPIIHTPAFTEYKIDGNKMRSLLTSLGLKIPTGMLDYWYYYTDLEGWGKILTDLVFKSNLYKEDKFDCDNFALKAMSECCERYGLNTLALAIGDIPQGRHAFNLFYHGEGFMLWEPNEGFEWSGQPFEIGKNGYKPELILI